MTAAPELPCSKEAEQAVLGSVLCDDTCYAHLAALLNPEDFHVEAHRRMWHAMADIHRVGGFIDRVTLSNRLQDAGHLQSVASIAKLDDMLGQVIGPEHYARIVKEHSIRRRAIFACQKAMNEFQQGGDSRDVLNRAQRVLTDLEAEHAQDRKLKTAGEIITEIGGLDQFFAQQKQQGVPTRWPGLNAIVSGLRAGQQIIIAARPSLGKTAAALDIAECAATHGTGTAFFSLEMPAHELIDRMACSRSRVDSNRYRHDALLPDERRRLSVAAAEIAEMPLYFDDSAGCTVPAIHAAVREKSAVHPIGLVLVDYLQLLQPVGKFGTREEAVSSMSRSLKLAAREFNCPFVVLSQLTRGPEHEKREPDLSDLRESGSIEQNADVVIFIHAGQQDYGTIRACKFLVKKQRNGPVGYVPLNFHRRFARFEESTEVEESD